MRKKIVVFLFIALLLFSMGATVGYFVCKNKIFFQDHKATIKIGAILPLTGESAYWGVNIKNGIELGIEEINKNGGILNKNLQIEYEDSKGDAKIGTDIANKFVVGNDVQAIVGDVISSVILAVSPILDKSKIPMIGFGESVAISNAGDYIFRNWNSAASDISITSEYASAHSKKIVLLYQNDAYGQSAKTLAQESIAKNNIKIVYQTEFNKGQTDYRTIIAKFNSLDYDSIYMVGFHVEALAFLKQSKELNIKNVNIYGVSSWEEGSLIDFIKVNYPNKVYYGYPKPPDSDSIVVKSFIENFKKNIINIQKYFAITVTMQYICSNMLLIKLVLMMEKK